MPRAKQERVYFNNYDFLAKRWDREDFQHVLCGRWTKELVDGFSHLYGVPTSVSRSQVRLSGEKRGSYTILMEKTMSTGDFYLAKGVGGPIHPDSIVYIVRDPRIGRVKCPDTGKLIFRPYDSRFDFELPETLPLKSAWVPK